MTFDFLTWKRTHLNKRKSWLHPMHLKEYLFICTEIEWILQYLNMLVSIYCKWSWRLWNGCPLWLLWIWQRGHKCCKDFCVEFFAKLELAMQHCHILSADEGWELKCINGFCGLKKVKCGDCSNHLQCGLCRPWKALYLCTLFIYPSVLMPRGQFWADLLLYPLELCLEAQGYNFKISISCS